MATIPAAIAVNYKTLVSGYTVTRSIVIKAGSGQLKRGQVLGKETATGKYSPTIIPHSVVLVDDIDATSADVEAPAYFQGRLKENLLELPLGTTIPEIFDVFDPRNLAIETVDKYPESRQVVASPLVFQIPTSLLNGNDLDPDPAKFEDAAAINGIGFLSY